MAVLKRKVDSKAKGFSPYAGPDPKPGVYRARLIQGSIRSKKSGRLAYNWLYELEATRADHKKYDGYSGFCEILLGEEEWAQAQEGAFVKAITGKDNFQNVNVAFTGKEEDFALSTGAPMTAFDGVKIANKIVNVNLRVEKERTDDEGKVYPAELRARGILPWKKTEEEDAEEDIADDDFAEDGEEEPETDEAETEEDEADEDDEEGEDDGEEMTEEEWEAAKEARRTELKSREFGLDKLREVLKAAGVDTKGMKKPELVEAIIDLEFAEEDEDADDTEAEEAEDAETESEEEAEEADDEDEEEEDEDEEEEADLESEIRAEAADLDRAALKKAIKALDADAKFKTSQSDDDLREIFVELKVSAPGF